jgi:hypothetical protein
VDDEMKRNYIDMVKKVNQIRDMLRDYQKEVEVHFVDDLNKIQERATHEDVNTLRQEMQIFAPMSNLRDLKKQIMPELRAVKMQVFTYG